MDASITPPFNLTHRFKPAHLAQCYMTGIVDGHKEFVTNVTANMNKDFSQIMQQVLTEAREGRFATKGDAVRRRGELVGITSSEPDRSKTTSDGGQDVN